MLVDGPIVKDQRLTQRRLSLCPNRHLYTVSLGNSGNFYFVNSGEIAGIATSSKIIYFLIKMTFSRGDFRSFFIMFVFQLGSKRVDCNQKEKIKFCRMIEQGLPFPEVNKEYRRKFGKALSR